MTSSKTEDKINWVDKIPVEYFLPNAERCERANIDWESLDEKGIQDLKPECKLISLQGFKWLLYEHGFEEIEEKGRYFDGEFVTSNDFRYNVSYVASCKIVWVNDKGEKTTVTTQGEAHQFSTRGFGRDYLARMACNRAFIANVKLFLDIPVYGSDEINTPEKPSQKSYSLKSQEIISLCNQAGIPFDELKERANKLKNMPPQLVGINSFGDLDKLAPWAVNKIIAGLKKKIEV